MHKLTNMEAQRVIAVMEDTLDKLNLLSYIPQTPQQELLDRLAKAGGTTVKAALQSEWQLEQIARRTGAIAIRQRGGGGNSGRSTAAAGGTGDSGNGGLPPGGAEGGIGGGGGGGGGGADGSAGAGGPGVLGAAATVVLSGMAAGPVGAATAPGVAGGPAGDGGLGMGAGTELGNSDTVDQIYHNVRVLCRSLKKYPPAMEVLYNSKETRPQSKVRFNTYLSDLTTIMHRRLSTTVEEEVANKRLLHDLTEKEKLAENERDALHQTLDATRTEKERTVGQLDTSIRKAKAELQEVVQTSVVEMEGIRIKAEDSVSKASEDNDRKIKALSEWSERLKKEVGELCEQHRDEEVAARKKKAKAEAELCNAVARYDKDMTEKTQQMEDIRAKMEAELHQLQELTEHFNRVDATHAQLDAEEAILSDVRRQVGSVRERMDGAATAIQSLFRGNMHRMEVAKMRKKAKKGKGKKGKKK